LDDNSYKINLKNPISGETYLISGKFPSEDANILIRYVEFCIQLLESEYMSLEKKASLNIKYDKEKGLMVVPYLPKVDICDAFFYRLRPFILQDEPTYFMCICSIIGKNIKDPLIHNILKYQRKVWRGDIIRSMFKIFDNEGILNDDNSVMKYINSYEYHRDQDKKERFEFLNKYFGTDGIRALFLLLVLEKAIAVINILELCEVIMGRRNILKIMSCNKKITDNHCVEITR